MEKTMKKDKPLKKPRGRQPIGAVLIDGKWQMTELATQLAAERVLRLRERGRIWYRKTRELLRIARPELFAPKGTDPRQTTLVPRSTEREAVRAPCQKTDTSTYDAVLALSATRRRWRSKSSERISIPLRSPP